MIEDIRPDVRLEELTPFDTVPHVRLDELTFFDTAPPPRKKSQMREWAESSALIPQSREQAGNVPLRLVRRAKKINLCGAQCLPRFREPLVLVVAL